MVERYNFLPLFENRYSFENHLHIISYKTSAYFYLVHLFGRKNETTENQTSLNENS